MIWFINLILFLVLLVIDQHRNLFGDQQDVSVLIASAASNLKAAMVMALVATTIGAMLPNEKQNYLTRFRQQFAIMLMVTLATMCAFVYSMG